MMYFELENFPKIKLIFVSLSFRKLLIQIYKLNYNKWYCWCKWLISIYWIYEHWHQKESVQRWREKLRNLRLSTMNFKFQVQENLEIERRTFCFNWRVGKRSHLDNVTNALTRDPATIGQIREDKWNQFSSREYVARVLLWKDWEREVMREIRISCPRVWKEDGWSHTEKGTVREHLKENRWRKSEHW